jgi:hypothetical protein
METNNHDSLMGLIRELRDETGTLLRQEIALAKAETSEKASRLGRNIAYMAGGAVFAMAALILVLIGLRDLIGQALVKAGMEPGQAIWLAAFLVAIPVAIGAGALIAKGKKALTEEGLTPEKTMDSLRQDQRFIKQKLART